MNITVRDNQKTSQQQIQMSNQKKYWGQGISYIWMVRTFETESCGGKFQLSAICPTSCFKLQKLQSLLNNEKRKRLSIATNDHHCFYSSPLPEVDFKGARGHMPPNVPSGGQNHLLPPFFVEKFLKITIFAQNCTKNILFP